MKTLFITLTVCLGLISTSFGQNTNYAVRESGLWSNIMIWKDNSSGKFRQSNALPDENSTVIINRTATIQLDLDTAISQLSVNSMEDCQSVLKLDQPFTLSTQRAVVGSIAPSGSGEIEITKGALDVTEYLRIRKQGKVLIDGGVLGSIQHYPERNVGGHGEMELSSGRIYFASPNRESILHFTVGLTTISGGIFEAADFVFGNKGINQGDRIFRVVGQEAQIKMRSMNQGRQNIYDGRFEFILSKEGVSPIQIEESIEPLNTKLLVDGSQFRGGPKSIPLFITGGLDHKFKQSDIEVIGLGRKDVDWKIVQNSETKIISISILKPR